ncbi:oligosaccharide flippase family protein [Gaetbulibacter aestuarii]|uniref:Oligosaccharide flippase family protein n=1 Tax=Gaetbulibacter aestuarii TaxID=1502358 RepID=A0ABW7MYG5_9FLAO
MISDKSSYRQIIKATSLFGGVQVINVLISIAKSKIAALLIGVSGFGIFGLLTSTLNLILGITRLGLDVSAVKEIAATNHNSDNVSKLVTITNRLTFYSGIAGALISLVFSPWLSSFIFGNENYALFFAIISITILFNQLTTGNIAILQGLKHLNSLAKVSVITSFFSLFPTILFYYFLGEKGIPWVILFSGLFGFLISKVFVDKLRIKRVSISFQKFLSESKNMLNLGFMLSLASLSGILIAYLIQIYITKEGSIKEVGFYNAGFGLIHSYVVVFFNALSKDYFPRLAEAEKDPVVINKMVNQQASMSVLFLTPIIILFLGFKSVLITLLYSKEFLPVLGMVTFGIVAIVFKAVSWSMGFVIIVKGNSKLYLITELASNIILFSLVILGYRVFGLTGAGVGYLLYHIIDFFIVKLVVTKVYSFYFDKKFKKLFTLCVLECFVMLLINQIESQVLKYFLLVSLILFSTIFTIIKLNQYTGLFDVFRKKRKSKM